MRPVAGVKVLALVRVEMVALPRKTVTCTPVGSVRTGRAASTTLNRLQACRATATNYCCVRASERQARDGDVRGAALRGFTVLLRSERAPPRQR
jgi:hypothetical protein